MRRYLTLLLTSTLMIFFAILIFSKYGLIISILVSGVSIMKINDYPLKREVFRDLGALFAAIIIATIPTTLLLVACDRFSAPVCDILKLRGVVFGNLYIPSLVFLIYWLPFRLPMWIYRLRGWLAELTFCKDKNNKLNN